MFTQLDKIFEKQHKIFEKITMKQLRKIKTLGIKEDWT